VRQANTIPHWLASSIHRLWSRCQIVIHSVEWQANTHFQIDVVGAFFHASGIVDITLPVWLLGIAYAVIGWYIGLIFTRDTVRAAIRALPQLLGATLGLIGLCALSAWMLAHLLHVDGLTAYLATTPGGLDSVAIIALGSGSNVSLILAVQTMRVFIVILTGPPLAKLIARYA